MRRRSRGPRVGSPQARTPRRRPEPAPLCASARFAVSRSSSKCGGLGTASCSLSVGFSPSAHAHLALDSAMEVVLDVDATDDPLHGEQEGRCFHGYYKNDCYLPLYIFCGGRLLCARLRSADEDGASGVVEELEGMVMRIRAKWPWVRVVVRGDGGFCRDESMAWCEGVDYVLGLSKNTRLLKLIGDEMAEARRLHEDSGEAVRLFKELRYRTRKSWSCERRVVAKSGALERWRESAVHRHFDTGRAVVGPRALRGRVLRAGRDGESHQGAAVGSACGPCASSHRMQANQLRLYFTSFAYVMMHG